MYISKVHFMFCSLEATSLGCHCDGYVMPIPNTRDSVNFEHSIRKRVAARMPDIDDQLLAEFASFVKFVIYSYLVPLLPSDFMSFYEWLDQSSYNGHRKQELIEGYEKASYGLNVRNYRCKSHLKQERLDEPKYARGIHSRCDVFKAYTGPVFASIEAYLFHRSPLARFFVKGRPPAERSRHVLSSVSTPGSSYVATDFSSFECGFSRKFMLVCEMVLYDYLTLYYPDKNWIFHVRNALAGINTCSSRLGKFRIEATRMSGDMCTSLGNCFTNLMISSFVMHKAGIPFAKLRACFEGDDGIIALPHGCVVDESIYARLGWKIKLVHHSALSHASFCGIVSDDEVGDNLVNPDEVLVKFGWSLSSLRFGGPRILNGLLHAKALSLMYEFPACPIVTSVAQYALRMTAGVPAIFDERDLRWSFRQSNREFCAPHAIDSRSRLVVERLWGISVERQLEVEDYFDHLNQLMPIPMSLVTHPDDSWAPWYQKYVLRGTRESCMGCVD